MLYSTNKGGKVLPAYQKGAARLGELWGKAIYKVLYK